MIENNSSQVVH